MTKPYHRPVGERKPSPRAPTQPTGCTIHCLACARARREGKPWGCGVHVAEDVLP